MVVVVVVEVVVVVVSVIVVTLSMLIELFKNLFLARNREIFSKQLSSKWRLSDQLDY